MPTMLPLFGKSVRPSGSAGETENVIGCAKKHRKDHHDEKDEQRKGRARTRQSGSSHGRNPPAQREAPSQRDDRQACLRSEDGGQIEAADLAARVDGIGRQIAEAAGRHAGGGQREQHVGRGVAPRVARLDLKRRESAGKESKANANAYAMKYNTKQAQMRSQLNKHANRSP